MTDASVEGIEALGLRMIAWPDFSIINYTADDVDSSPRRWPPAAGCRV